MEFEFDKEMDAILRKARGSEVATSPSAHLDADEISAFAESALTDAARQRYTAHLADCTRCRKILSNVILMNSEAETETASSAVSTKIAETSVPWYRKLFTFPQLAYAMGAMVLLFSGFFGYLILQNLPGGREVSYSANSAANKSAPQAAPYAASNSNTAANISAPAMNSSVPMNTPAVTNSAPFSASNTNTSTTTAEKKSAQTENAPVIAPQPMATPEAKPQVKDEEEKNLSITRNEAQSNQPSSAGAVREDNKRDKKENPYTVDGRSADDSVSQEKLKTERSIPENRKQPSKAGDTRNVGGKTFNNVGGIWFDSAYGKQKQKTVRRGTSEYQKLDAGLRSIADQLGGTVVILWNGKAYRIQ